MQTIAILKPTFIPVAHLLDGCYLLIDKTKASTDPNYLWLLNQTEYEFLNLNFELFVDRYIVSQGANFWKFCIQLKIIIEQIENLEKNRPGKH